MYTANEIADYVIFRIASDDDSGVMNLKLQKLLYYCQAWKLAFDDSALFEGAFQAWIHGPVNRTLYDRFKGSKSLYSLISMKDIEDAAIIEKIDAESKSHINSILDAYAPFSATDLEVMTHREDPWIQARKGYSPTQRCEEVIDEKLMKQYYRKRLE